MLKSLALAILITGQVICAENNDLPFVTTESGFHKTGENPVLSGSSLPENEQKALEQLELQTKNTTLCEQLQEAVKRIEILEALQAQNRTTPPVYKKIIPADKILATSFIFATLSFYQMYMFSGSLTLALGSFFTNLYSCYAFLKIARDAASVAGNSPFVNKIG